MRSFREFTVDIIKKPPIAFPLVALFHVLLLLWTIWDDSSIHFPDKAWLEVVWMVGYTTFWIAATDMRKWGALGYIMLTVLNTAIFFAARYHKVPNEYVNNMSLIDVLFSMILLYYYKNFR